MKNIRNTKLQQLCERELDLKDIILNFDDGLVYIYSDNDETQDKLVRAENQIIAGEGGAINSFLKYSIEEWFEIIKNWYDNNFPEDSFVKKSHWIKIFSATKKKIKKSSPKVKKAIKKTNPKVKKTVKKPNKQVKPKNTSKRFKIKPKKTLTKKPNNTIKPSKKAPKSQNKPVSKRYKIRTTTGEWPHQDISTPAFEELLDQGYNMATFVAYPGACKFCQKLNGKTWTLQNFLDTTEYDAPIFSHSHVNAFSEIKVWDKNGELEPVYVNYEGNIR